MSILAKDRTPTTVDYFDTAKELRKRITREMKDDFGDDKKYVTGADGKLYQNRDFWLYVEYRDALFRQMDALIANITQSRTIVITNYYEYNGRRKYWTDAIGNCETILQIFNSMTEDLPIPAGKYVQHVPIIKREAELLRKERKKDNDKRKELDKKYKKQ